MKLLRWALTGASVYVVYKYGVGRKAKGEDVFVTPEGEASASSSAGASTASPKRSKGRRA